LTDERVERAVEAIVFNKPLAGGAFLLGLMVVWRHCFNVRRQALRIVMQIRIAAPSDVIVGILTLVVTLTANLIVIVICSSYEISWPNQSAEHPNWPEGVVRSGSPI